MSKTPILINLIADQTVFENQFFSFQIPENTFSDPDAGDTLHYVFIHPHSPNIGILYDLFYLYPTPITSWLTFDPETRTFTGTPIDSGIFNVTVGAIDRSGATIFDTFTITVEDTVNDSPIIQYPFLNPSAVANIPFVYQIPSELFIDPDPNDTLSYKITLSDGNDLPNWLTFEPNTLTLNGLPTPENLGSIELQITATDNAGASASQTIYLNVYDIFDAAQYGASNPDLIEKYGYDLGALTQHYITYGRDEYRPLDNFNELRYVASNPNLIPVLGTDNAVATRHYIENSYFQGLSLTAFDPKQYLASHKDLITTFGYDLEEGTRHYINFGYQEGRETDTFDEWRYLASNPDLLDYEDDLLIIEYGFSTLEETAQSYLYLPVTSEDAAQHYIQYGYQEGRKTDLFNPAQYIAGYDDLINTYGSNFKAGSQHYVEFGHQEERDPLRFKSDLYIASNSDLILEANSRFGDVFYGNYDDVLEFGNEHFVEFGFGEGRSRVELPPLGIRYHAEDLVDPIVKTTFNPYLYLAVNPDLQAAFNDNVEAATRHYIEFGYQEQEAGLRPRGFIGIFPIEPIIEFPIELTPVLGTN